MRGGPATRCHQQISSSVSSCTTALSFCKECLTAQGAFHDCRLKIGDNNDHTNNNNDNYNNNNNDNHWIVVHVPCTACNTSTLTPLTSLRSAGVLSVLVNMSKEVVATAAVACLRIPCTRSGNPRIGDSSDSPPRFTTECRHMCRSGGAAAELAAATDSGGSGRQRRLRQQCRHWRQRQQQQQQVGGAQQRGPHRTRRHH